MEGKRHLAGRHDWQRKIQHRPRNAHSVLHSPVGKPAFATPAGDPLLTAPAHPARTASPKAMGASLHPLPGGARAAHPPPTHKPVGPLRPQPLSARKPKRMARADTLTLLHACAAPDDDPEEGAGRWMSELHAHQPFRDLVQQLWDHLPIKSGRMSPAVYQWVYARLHAALTQRQDVGECQQLADADWQTHAGPPGRGAPNAPPPGDLTIDQFYEIVFHMAVLWYRVLQMPDPERDAEVAPAEFVAFFQSRAGAVLRQAEGQGFGPVREPTGDAPVKGAIPLVHIFRHSVLNMPDCEYKDCPGRAVPNYRQLLSARQDPPGERRRASNQRLPGHAHRQASSRAVYLAECERTETAPVPAVLQHLPDEPGAHRLSELPLNGLQLHSVAPCLDVIRLNRGLRHLLLNDNRLPSDDVELLATALATQPGLQVLDLSGNPCVSSRCVAALHRLLRTNRSITLALFHGTVPATLKVWLGDAVEANFHRTSLGREDYHKLRYTFDRCARPPGAAVEWAAFQQSFQLHAAQTAHFTGLNAAFVPQAGVPLALAATRRTMQRLRGARHRLANVARPLLWHELLCGLYPDIAPETLMDYARRYDDATHPFSKQKLSSTAIEQIFRDSDVDGSNTVPVDVLREALLLEGGAALWDDLWARLQLHQLHGTLHLRREELLMLISDVAAPEPPEPATPKSPRTPRAAQSPGSPRPAPPREPRRDSLGDGPPVGPEFQAALQASDGRIAVHLLGGLSMRAIYHKECKRLGVAPIRAVLERLPGQLATYALQALPLSGYRLQSLGPFVDILRLNRDLRYLFLQGNCLPSADIQLLAIILRHHPHLQSLDLSHNPPVTAACVHELRALLALRPTLTTARFQGTVPPAMEPGLAAQLEANYYADRVNRPEVFAIKRRLERVFAAFDAAHTGRIAVRDLRAGLLQSGAPEEWAAFQGLFSEYRVHAEEEFGLDELIVLRSGHANPQLIADHIAPRQTDAVATQDLEVITQIFGQEVTNSALRPATTPGTAASTPGKSSALSPVPTPPLSSLMVSDGAVIAGAFVQPSDRLTAYVQDRLSNRTIYRQECERLQMEVSEAVALQLSDKPGAYDMQALSLGAFKLQSIRPLLDILRLNETVKYVFLKENALQEEDIQLLANLLCTHPRVQSLDLSSNPPVSARGAQALYHLLCANPNITTARFYGTVSVGDMPHLMLQLQANTAAQSIGHQDYLNLKHAFAALDEHEVGCVGVSEFVNHVLAQSEPLHGHESELLRRSHQKMRTHAVVQRFAMSGRHSEYEDKMVTFPELLQLLYPAVTSQGILLCMERYDKAAAPAHIQLQPDEIHDILRRCESYAQGLVYRNDLQQRLNLEGKGHLWAAFLYLFALHKLDDPLHISTVMEVVTLASVPPPPPTAT